ncbi:MAG: rod shape determining protein RodA [Tepidanaerobacteraceae bacterium]|nr:rod shape determining protein RodA [Tepidanaerobacteraceae bacterium]
MNRKLLKYIDYPILILILLITTLSILIISSATHATSPGGSFHYAKMQFLWFCIGLLAMFFIMSIDYHTIAYWSNVIYAVNLCMLIAVMIIGRESMGAQRWIPIGSFGLQPSEFAKLAVVITLAKYLERKKVLNDIKDVALAFLHVGLPLILIMKQPDLGTSLVLLAILFGMIFVAGISYKLFGAIIGSGILCLPLVWRFLKPYQKKRIIVFLNPNLDPLGAGYHVIQSKIAIGSGRLLGKGLFHGTQNQLDFIPEQHTDFIFAVLGEELGFIGGMLLLILFFLLLYRTIQIALKARDLLGTYMVVGIATMWTFQILVNIGMTLGIMPVTGIPLPFMSYGGSSFLMNMISVGIVLNVGMRRQKILF